MGLMFALSSVVVMYTVLVALPPGAEAQEPAQPEIQPPLETPPLEDPSPGEPMPTPPAEELPAEREWEGMTIVDVQVEGTERIDSETVRQRIRLQPGDVVDGETITAEIRRVHDLGYFDDIQVAATEVADGEVALTFIVEEKPALDAIEYVGLDALSEDEVGEVVQLQRFAILNISQVNRSAEAIRDLYREEGYFLAEVDFDVRTREDRPDLAVVTFTIHENPRVEVKRVTFLGNQALSDDELQSVMATREGNLLSFLTGMGSFKEQDFEDDLQRITAFYYDHGYVDVQVQMPTLRLSPDKEHLYITIRVEEGPLHFPGTVDISGDLLAEHEELLAMTRLGEEEVFRYGRLQQDMMALSRFYQDEGYANVQVNPLHRIDPQTQRVDVTYDIQKGEKVRVGRIEVSGNRTTRDQVIRREFVIEEGDWYSATDLERSQARVHRLGYFQEVNIGSRQTGDPGIIDLEFEVVERPTGTFQLGAGLSSQENFIFQGQVSQENLFGRGQTLQLSAQASSIRTLFNLRFVEPWLFGTRWNFATDLYNFDFLYQDFARRSLGGTLSFGYPIGEAFNLPMGDALRASLRYKLEDVTVRPGGITGANVQPGSPLFQGGLTSSLRLGLRYDTRDNVLFPTSGMFHDGSVEVADGTWTLSGNEFVKFDGDVRGYVPLFWDFVLRLNARGGYVMQTAEDKPVPIFERYFAGGPETVRGFERFSLGPVQRVPATHDDPAGGLETFRRGGNKKLILTAEVEFPILAAAQLRGVLFADAGNAFDDGQALTLRPDLFASDDELYANALRTAVGFGVRWFSPIGPLRFEWGFPMQRLPGERPMVFDFSIQQSF